jgi:pyruvate/2-oxoglutarate dehydrogenase complex dihydrolipoamide dehydrogenase (E3) component
MTPSSDAHDRALAAAVFPADWTNPEPAGPRGGERYNLVVLGAGTAGLVTAAVAAGLGARVALVEREARGGDCLNVGGVPSKALLRSARAVADVRRAGRFGVRVTGPVEVDFPAVMERMRRLRAGLAPHDSAARFRDLGVDVFLGRGRFTGPDSVAVEGPAGDRALRFARACIATGARPVVPDVPGLAEAGFLTNESVFALSALPARLAVVGGGPIGCELAQAFARFGARVTLVERADRLLEREHPDAAAIVQRALVEDGVELALGSTLKGVRRATGGARLLELEAAGATRALEVDELLIGVGRAPNVQDLGLALAGVDHDPQRGVQVDDHLRTGNRRVYAAGDVCSRYRFTHVADAAAAIVVRNALFFGRQRFSALTVPWTTYTDPEVAHVGLDADGARERGLALDTFRVEMADVDRAVLEGDTEGFLEVRCERGKDRILGATLVSRHAGETISELTLAMVSGAGLKSIAGTIHPYPTQAAALRQAANLQLKTRLTPLAARALERCLAWRR